MNKNAEISLEISQIFPVADHNELDKEKKTLSMILSSSQNS